MTPVLGIDIAKATFDAVLLLDEQSHHIHLKNTAAGFRKLQRWLAQYSEQPVHACLEATGRYGDALAHFLYHAGHRVSIVNPKRIKAFADVMLWRSKTDATDAQLIAHFCQTHTPDLWTPPEPARVQLRQQTRYLQTLKNERQRLRNRLKSGINDPLVCQLMQAQLDFIIQQIQSLQHAIQRFITQHPKFKQLRRLLLSIPGIGPLTAAILIAELDDLHRFKRPGQLVAYVGLDVIHHCSGTSVKRRSRISKQGNQHIRTALFFPAIVAQTYNPILNRTAQRLKKRGTIPMKIVITLMRKLLHQVYGILKSGTPFDPHFLENTGAIA